jgi:hypothetical protein
MKLLSCNILLVIAPVFLAGCHNLRERSENLRPNILIAMGDDISWSHTGAYGTSWIKTPGFDRVAFDSAGTPRQLTGKAFNDRQAITTRTFNAECSCPYIA